jgi:hypothetical protein
MKKLMRKLQEPVYTEAKPAALDFDVREEVICHS